MRQLHGLHVTPSRSAKVELLDGAEQLDARALEQGGHEAVARRTGGVDEVFATQLPRVEREGREGRRTVKGNVRPVLLAKIDELWPVGGARVVGGLEEVCESELGHTMAVCPIRMAFSGRCE